MNAITRRNHVIRTWEQDYQRRMNPPLLSTLLHKAVPVLSATNWQVSVVEPGYCETTLPLNSATTNQHGTHQAALISLSADYTGGIALASLIRGVPFAGVHKCSPEESASLWLAAMNVKYVRPSTGHLTGRCRVPDKQAKKIVQRYTAGKRVLVSLPVVFESNGEIVAEAEMKYFAQPTRNLMSGPIEKSTLLNAKAKASARMIAGVRARSFEDQKGTFFKGPRIDCAHASTAAGPHGMLLADKMNRALPQLADMVMARTTHVDKVTDSIPDLKQVVMLGAGLDMRPFRDSFRGRGLRFFELDLPEMLHERERVSREVIGYQVADRTMIPINFLKDDIAEALLANEKFCVDVPSLFIYEGCSMYFSPEINKLVLDAVRSVMGHPESRLWADFVDVAAIDGSADEASVAAFLERMTDLGESFTCGVKSPEELLSPCKLKLESAITTNELFDHIDPAEKHVLDLYWFTVSSPC